MSTIDPKDGAILDAIKALECTCLRCNSTWTQRTAYNPRRCPRCGSPKWNKPRKEQPAKVTER